MKKQCCEQIISSTSLRSTSLQSSQMRIQAKVLVTTKARVLHLTNMEPTWDDLALLHVLWHSILKLGGNATHGRTSVSKVTNPLVFSWHSSMRQCLELSNPPRYTIGLDLSSSPAKMSFTALSATISMFLSWAWSNPTHCTHYTLHAHTQQITSNPLPPLFSTSCMGAEKHLPVGSDRCPLWPLKWAIENDPIPPFRDG